MKWFSERLARLRTLPTPLLLLPISGKFVFGVGLGMLLASRFKKPWRRIGWMMMLSSLAMGAPAAVKIFRR